MNRSRKNQKKNHGKYYSPSEAGAISRAIKTGKQLQLDYPEVADMYRHGLFLSEIVDQLHIVSHYNVSENVAIGCVRYAIHGYEGGFGIEEFDGLIKDKSELQRLFLEHVEVIGKKNYQGRKGIHGLSHEKRTEIASLAGRISHALRKGVHGRTLEQMSEDGRKGSQKLRELGIGIFAQTIEDKKEIGYRSGLQLYRDKKGIFALTVEEKKKIGLKTVLKKGQTPWIEREETETYTRLSEKEFAYRLSRSSLCQYSGGRAGKPNAQLIADSLNELYHQGRNVRTSVSVHNILKLYRRSVGFKVPQNSPWASEEKAFVCRLSELPEYQYYIGKNKGRANMKSITRKVNEKFHQGKDIRSFEAIRALLLKVKKLKVKQE
ncbi:hypothetical protein HYV49_05450 [Candidatus Pacearchaeota archaeon]|nr:hypothetical protein [Candidatus Pacearchaeota archaeon]